jgi:hypothetical protein
MELESLQESTTRHYPEPDESKSHNSKLFL